MNYICLRRVNSLIVGESPIRCGSFVIHGRAYDIGTERYSFATLSEREREKSFSARARHHIVSRIETSYSSFHLARVLSPRGNKKEKRLVI